MHQPAVLPRPTQAYLDNCRWILDHYAELVRRHGVGWLLADQRDPRCDS